MAGTKIMLSSANCQFTTNRMIGIARIRTTTSNERIMPMFTKRRMASTSAVARDIRSPVCSLSWKAKLTFWSLSYSKFLQSKATFWESDSVV